MQRTAHFFIPVFHDAPSFQRLREEILRVLPPAFEARFHLLDDSAGRDPALRNLNLPDVSVSKMPGHLGHQRALVLGLRSFLSVARDGVVITLDADGEDRPEDLPAMLSDYLAHEADRPIVLAQRTRREEGLSFRLSYLAYRQLFRVLTGTSIQTGNFAVLHPAALAAIISHPFFDYAYAGSLVALGANVRLVPCPRGRRYEGQSKMSYARLAAHGGFTLVPFLDRIAYRGALVAMACLGLGVAVEVARGIGGW